MFNLDNLIKGQEVVYVGAKQSLPFVGRGKLKVTFHGLVTNGNKSYLKFSKGNSNLIVDEDSYGSEWKLEEL